MLSKLYLHVEHYWTSSERLVNVGEMCLMFVFFLDIHGLVHPPLSLAFLSNIWFIDSGVYIIKKTF